MNRREITKRSQQRALRAVELRRAGLTFEDIGQLIGHNGPVTVSSARHIVRKGEYILARREARGV